MRRTFHLLLFALLVGAIAASAIAQSTTATIRGKVTNDKGAPAANAEINTVDVATGFVRTVKAGPDGSFSLSGLTPGELTVVVAATGFEPRSEVVRVLVGQNLEVNFVLNQTAVLNESITVVGNQLVETRSSEAATNVTRLQIESLPQDDRNVSFKNDVLQGGVAGQDSSRGNPFPQNAVQEFRVITQNYDAQYEKASSAIITAITKSGGNQLDGTVFTDYQPKGWVAPTPKGFQFSTLTTNQAYKRYQSGISLGGPLIEDKLNFFVSYEGDQEMARDGVSVGNSLFASQFAAFTGVFPSPFKSTLLFGKMSWQPLSNQLVDLSSNYRREHETRDFGAQTSFQSGTDLKNYVYGTTLRDQWNNNTALNQATVSLQKYGWNPTPLNPNLVGLNYEGIIRLGGNSTTQNFDQRRLEFRDDYNWTGFRWHGEHSFQVGGNFDFLKYKVNKSLNGNPEFDFRIDPANHLTLDQPYQAIYGFGNPFLTTSNRETGVFGQDNWTVNQHLALKLGLRWDYESHMLDENYVTPANIVAGLTGKVSTTTACS